MIRVLFFVSVFLSCLPFLHSAADGNNSLAICPESFSCPGLGALKYPFYNVTDKKCGLIKINCTSKEIQFGGWVYEFVGKFDLDNDSNHNSDYIAIYNRTFQQLVKNKSCDALTYNFTPPSPSPLLYSVSIIPTITLFKCRKNLTYPQQQEPYFDKHSYNSYNKCKDHNFYYNYFNGTIPSDLAPTCQVVQLPVNVPSSRELIETNIFSLLSPVTAIAFNLSDSCRECQKVGRQCETTKDGLDVHCFDVKKVKPGGEQTTILNTGKKGRKWTRIKILAITGSVFILVLSFVIFITWCHCKSNPFSYVSSKNISPNLEDISFSFGVSVFSYEELEDATQNFDPSHELGDGGFGAVYYGKLRDGRNVAVKKLHEHPFNRVQQFRNEVEILTKLRHPNLVVLYGCTSRQSRELLLVYEYVSNGTVADHLHGELSNQNMLTWPIRMNIAIETASALVYLHASEIIHRDVKTSNILLDHNFSVKLADFGFSRLIPNDVTHVSTAPQGTPGYVDPQYYEDYQLTDKSDVYSFGVVLIELVSSMMAIDLNRAQDEISLADLALNRIQSCEIDELIDPVLGSDTDPEIMNMITLVVELAFRCLQYDSDMRPTMNEVLDVLMDIQDVSRIDTYDSIKDLQTVNMLPLSETNDAVVLLKDFRPSPVSVTKEWQSNNGISTTLSSNGDRLSFKNNIDTYKTHGK
ncbi:putative protein kinase RLK-Pelle-WAK-LRK10L-1 family [Helianthus debilis subsp. tardiflorus]